MIDLLLLGLLAAVASMATKSEGIKDAAAQLPLAYKPNEIPPRILLKSRPWHHVVTFEIEGRALSLDKAELAQHLGITQTVLIRVLERLEANGGRP